MTFAVLQVTSHVKTSYARSSGPTSKKPVQGAKVCSIALPSKCIPFVLGSDQLYIKNK